MKTLIVLLIIAGIIILGLVSCIVCLVVTRTEQTFVAAPGTESATLAYYVINLDRSVDRYNSFISQKQLPPFKRVAALDARDHALCESYRNTYHPDLSFSNMSEAECAIWLSHLKALREFVENAAASHACIAEDDAFFSKPLPVDMTQFQEVYGTIPTQQPHILMLNNKFLPRAKSIKKTHSHAFYKRCSTRCGWGLQLYLVSKNTAKYLLEDARGHIATPIDTYWRRTQTVFVHIHPIAIVDDSVKSEKRAIQSEIDQKNK